MHNHPSLKELIEAVKSFIDDTAAPAMKGHASFHAKVASNVLSTVVREIEAGPSAASEEKARLLGLLQATSDTDLDQLNRDLCDLIRVGEITPNTPGIIDHLKSTAISQLNIDQPHYSGRKRLR